MATESTMRFGWPYPPISTARDPRELETQAEQIEREEAEAAGDATEECDMCFGRGSIEYSQYYRWHRTTCSTCGGSGLVAL